MRRVILTTTSDRYPGGQIFLLLGEAFMGSNQVLAIVLLIVGGILLYFGFQSSQSLGDQLSEAVTGRFTDSTMWYFIAGGALSAAGVGMLFFKR